MSLLKVLILFCTIYFSVRSMFRLRFLRDVYSLAALLILLLSLSYIVYSFWPRASGSQHINVLEDYVRAVQHLNKSSTALERLLAGFPGGVPDVVGVYGVRDRLARYLHNISTVYGSSDSFLVNVARSYLSIAEASTRVVGAYGSLSPSVNGLREALELLALCRVGEALDKYSGVEGGILDALSYTASAIDTLRGVDTGYIAENHTPIVNTSLRKLERVYESLYSADKVMQIARRYRGAVEAVCRGGEVDDEALLNSMVGELRSVRASGPLSPEIMAARNSLLSLIQLQLAAQGWGSQGNGGQGQQVGGGAGYAPPESDD